MSRHGARQRVSPPGLINKPIARALTLGYPLVPPTLPARHVLRSPQPSASAIHCAAYEATDIYCGLRFKCLRQ